MNLEKFNTKTPSHEDTKIEDEFSHQITNGVLKHFLCALESLCLCVESF
jgi:hypothetical protein